MGFHLPELVVVLVVALLVFGPKKLPEMGSSIGKSVQAFRKGVREISNPQDDEVSNPGNAAIPDPAVRDALPTAQKDSSGQKRTSSTNEEIRPEKPAE